MKKILIISDTHRNQALLRQIIQPLKDLTHIFHLGDSYEDLDHNPDLTDGKTLIRVPGLFHPNYLDGTIPRVQSAEIEGWKFQLVHFVKDLKAVPNDVDIVFYGHTHRWNCKKLDGIYFANPGHLKNYSDRGQAASYIIMSASSSRLLLEFFDFNHQLFHKLQIDK